MDDAVRRFGVIIRNNLTLPQFRRRLAWWQSPAPNPWENVNMIEIKHAKDESRRQRRSIDDRGRALVRVFLVALCTLLCPAVIAHGGETSTGITYNVSFADYSEGSILQWLAKKGFAPKRDAADPKRVVLSFANKSLVLETKRRAAGLLLNETDVQSYSRIRISRHFSGRCILRQGSEK